MYSCTKIAEHCVQKCCGDTEPNGVASHFARHQHEVGNKSECQRRGVKVPEDMLIAGFGAFDISDISTPAISTIDAHAYEIGATSGALLAGLLRGDPPIPNTPTITRLSPALKVARSTSAKM